MSHDYGKKDQSYGVVPLMKVKGKWNVLLIEHGASKYWGFPKGHAEKGEKPLEAAVRELKEETDLDVVRLFSEEVLEVHYKFTWHGKLVSKTVYFFVAEVSGEVLLQAEEVSGSRWVPLEEAEKCLTYDTDKNLYREALQVVDN